MSGCVHGTGIALEGRGILLMGPPGCGKSDLALRMIGRGARLIGDDLVRLEVRDHRLHLLAPGDAAPRLDVAHIGMVSVAAQASAPLALAVALGPLAGREAAIGAAELLPGWHAPQVRLVPLEPSAPDKLLLALTRWGH